MKSTGPMWWGTLIALLGASVFIREIVTAFRAGTVRIPIQMFGADEYARGDAMFWLAVAMNSFGAVLFLGVGYAAWRTNQ